MDREKVIKGIRKCLSHKPCSENGCPYENECAVEHLNDPLLRDALTLLKEQEAKKEYKSCSNCSHSKYQAVRGTGGYDYRCQRHKMWGACDFHCSDWSKKGEQDA